MIERLAIVLGAAVLMAGFYWAMRWWQIRRTASFAPEDPLLSERRPDVPAILYFTTPMCAPCRTRQRPAIRELLAELGEAVQVIEVDATVEPDAASRWGVLSVPTTFILDRDGRTRQVNHGVAGTEKLRAQIQGL